jgi:trimeric autotransporter adhesin
MKTPARTTDCIHRSLGGPAFFLLMLACFGLSRIVQAVVPPPDGGYPGGNTAEGTNAQLNLTSGTFNTAVGFLSLQSTTTGSFNTATGAGTLLVNSADGNTATGAGALLSNTTGDRNTANGTVALFNNTTGDSNTAGGWQALLQNTTGARNTASGRATLTSNTTGFENTATGAVALQNNTSGNDNTATGFAALNGNIAGALNTATGVGALASSTGDLNIALGFGAGANLPTGNNNIYVGNIGVAAEANRIRVGTEVAVVDPFGVTHPAHTATYIAGITGTEAIGGDTVFVTSEGKLGTVSVLSSARFKQDVKSMDNVSEALFSLKPITFRYKKELDPKGTLQFGLMAEDVVKVVPDLVKRDRDGKLQTVRYDHVNAMLLNEFLKEHRKVQEQEATIAVLKKEMDTVVARLKEQDSKMERVSAQVKVTRAVRQTVLNNP